MKIKPLENGHGAELTTEAGVFFTRHETADSQETLVTDENGAELDIFETRKEAVEFVRSFETPIIEKREQEEEARKQRRFNQYKQTVRGLHRLSVALSRKNTFQAEIRDAMEMCFSDILED